MEQSLLDVVIEFTLVHRPWKDGTRHRFKRLGLRWLKQEFPRSLVNQIQLPLENAQEVATKSTDIVVERMDEITFQVL